MIIDLGEDVILEMVEIPEESFLIGSAEDEEGRCSDESPQHQMTVEPFYIGKFPVSQAQ